MPAQAICVIVGGTSGLGRGVAEALVARGERVAITGRDQARAQAVADEIGGGTTAIAMDLAAPETLGAALAGLGPVKHLVLCAIERDDNGVRNFDIGKALRLVTLKLVGYTEVIHQLAAGFPVDASIVLLGGLAKDRPYPGSTTVSTVNGGVTGMVRTLAVELAPVRVNAVHPGVIGDTPAWSSKPDAVLDGLAKRTPTGKLATTRDVAGAVLFLLDNAGVNGVNLPIDGGWLLV